MSSNRMGFQFLVSLGLMAMVAGVARADFTLLAGNNPQSDENVLLRGDATGMQGVGLTNQTGSAVLFESASQFLVNPSLGQARIEARDTDGINATQVAVDDDITIALVDPQLGFRSLIVNAFIGGGLGSGGDLSFLVSGLDAGGSPINETLGPETIGNGSNFFTLVATDGQLFKSVTVSPGANASYADLRQIRIGGIIPEPSAAALLAVLLPLLALGRRWTKR